MANEEDDGEGAVFNLNLKDADLLSTIRKPIQDSEGFWEGKDLPAIREKNVNLWLPKHWTGEQVYNHQENSLYQDNRIFSSVETIISTVNSRIPNPDVMPAQETLVSEQSAKDLQKVMFAHSERHNTLDLFRVGMRNLLLKRIGVIKLRWNKDYGKLGDIEPEHVPPEDLIIDKDARLYDVPRYIAQRVRDKTVEELLQLFPDAKQQIYQMAGVKRKDKKGDLVAYTSQLSRQFDFYEVWFTYVNEGVNSSAVAWVDAKFQYVFGKMQNPNWNYEDEKNYTGNILPMPAPPYFFINGYLNDGTSVMDQTTLVEQAAPLQKVLDRRGFQIMENSEMAGSGMVFNTNMITKEDIGKLIGAPDEKIGVKGDVRSAVTRIPPPPLPNYVIDDKHDARQAIDNIFATHEVTRGQESRNKTLGQDQLQLQANLTRMDDIARAVERCASAYYKYLAQMMKVYYTEEHYFRVTGEDGQFDYLTLKGDNIEDGIDVKVEAGSTMPIDKNAQRQWAETLASMQMIDPLSLYEVGMGGNLPTPKKMLERYMTFVSDPMAFTNQTKEEDFDRNAYLDIEILLRGEVPKQRDEVTPSYLRMFNKFMAGGEFIKQPTFIQQLFVEFLRVAEETAQKQLELAMTQMPSEEEIAESNRRAVEQAEQERAVTGGVNPEQEQPQPPEEESTPVA